MMIGSYPCCEGHLWIPMPDRTPAYAPEDCPHCGAKVWHRFSRVEPKSWTEAAFLEEYVVDEETRQVTAKPGTDAEAFDTMNRNPDLIAAVNGWNGALRDLDPDSPLNNLLKPGAAT